MSHLDDARVVDTFAAAFPEDADPVTYDNMAVAIGAFERGLVTPSNFDRYLAGDDAALSPAARSGLEKFVSLGCASCHNGVGFGGWHRQGAALRRRALRGRGRRPRVNLARARARACTRVSLASAGRARLTLAC